MHSALFTHAVSTETADTTTHDYVIPSGISAGKLLILILTHDGQIASTTGLDSAGFTLFGQYDIGASAGGADIEVWYKITNGSETNSTYGTTVAEKTVTHTLLISNYEPHTLFQLSDFRENGVSSANPPNLSPTWGLRRTLWFVFIGGDIGNSSTWSIPTGYALIDTSKTGTASGDVATYLIYKRDRIASNDPPTVTLDQSMLYCALTIGIQPEHLAMIKKNPP